jgi:uncharacterized membrane protein YgaE (UPF0421/DUF939 family)
MEYFIDYLISIIVILLFFSSMFYTITHNPNYHWKEILKKPWKIFDLINHSHQTSHNKLKKLRKNITKIEKQEEIIDKENEITETELEEIINFLNDCVEKDNNEN